jgi:hypothetical protein
LPLVSTNVAGSPILSGMTDGPQVSPIPNAAPPPSDLPSGPPPNNEPRMVARVWLIAAIAALFVVSGLAGYLLNAASQWQMHSAQMDQVNIDLGAEVATLRTDLAGTQAELDAVRSQLSTAQERIIELANEKAQIGDQREYQRQLTDYQTRVTDAARLVAVRLEECIVGQQEIISLLATALNSGQTSPGIDDLIQQVDTVCGIAAEAHDNLQEEIGR